MRRDRFTENCAFRPSIVLICAFGGLKMGIIQAIKDFLFGVEFIRTSELNEFIESLTSEIDRNHNGMISVNEFLESVKAWMKMR